MLSPAERKKAGFPMRHSGELKKYESIYQMYSAEGYTASLCDTYSDAFVDNAKKPSPVDIVQLSTLYDRIHELKTARFYLDMLQDKKLSGEEKYDYCNAMLSNISKQGKWRDAEEFRTENINFMQKYSEKVEPRKRADMYIALALADCAARKYSQALKLLKFGYKPHGKNDTTLLEIFITVVYIFACAGDKEGLEGALGNTRSCMKLFKGFQFPWQNAYYEQRIEDAANGII